MVKRIVTETTYTDDIDGGKAEGTIAFSFEGTDYEIDLSRKNAREFERAVAVYVGHARRVRNTRPRRDSASGTHDLAAVRAWARANGYAISNRGRVAGEVIAAFEAAGY